MSVTAPAPPAAPPSQAELEDILLELLGDLLRKDTDDLRAELEAKGTAMPVDSLDLCDVLVEFRQRTGLKIPKRKLRRHTMRSVSAFAAFAASEGTR